MELLRSEAKLVIPFLSEATDKGFAKELVEADAAFCTKANGVFADVPAVVIKTSKWPQLLLANRVEVAADGFLLQQTAV